MNYYWFMMMEKDNSWIHRFFFWLIGDIFFDRICRIVGVIVFRTLTLGKRQTDESLYSILGLVALMGLYGLVKHLMKN